MICFSVKGEKNDKICKGAGATAAMFSMTGVRTRTGGEGIG